MRIIIRNIIRTIIRIIERTPIDNQGQKNIIDKVKYLQEFELDSKDGFIFGSLRLADLDIKFINDIIYQENYKIERLEGIINEEHKELYEQVKAKKKLFTYDEFIKKDRINDKSKKVYTNTLEGYFEYIKDVKPQLANFFLDYFQPYFKDSVRHCHSYITGKSGLGKSEIMKNIIINHILRKNCSVVLIEPHGDLAKQIYKSKVFLDQEQEKRLVVVDYTLDVNHTPIINIFDQIKWENNNPIETESNIDRISQEYAKALTTICTNSKSAELSYKMEMLLRFCVRIVLVKENGCLQDLKRFMDSSNNADLVELGMKDQNEATADFFNTKFNQKGYNETKEAVFNRLESVLLDSTFKNMTTGKSTVKLKSCIDQKKVIIINLSKGSMGSYASSSMGKLILAIINIVGLQRSNAKFEYLRTYTHVFIDEFQNYVSDTMREVLEELRKYNIFLTLANQFVGQDLDSDQMKSIFANTGMKIVAQTSPDNSHKIAKEIEVKPELLNSLAQGEYYLMYSNSKKIPITVKIKGSLKYLGDSYENKETWERIKIRQISDFYKKIGFYKYEPPKTQQSENKPPNKGDKSKNNSRRSGEKPNFNDLDF